MIYNFSIQIRQEDDTPETEQATYTLQAKNAQQALLYFMDQLNALQILRTSDKVKEDPEQIRAKDPAPVKVKSSIIDYWKSWEETPEGRAFIEKIRKARDFEEKNRKTRYLTISQLRYISDKHNKNAIDASFDLCALAYRAGYTDGRRAARK